MRKLFPKNPDDPVGRDILQGSLVLLAVAVLMFFIGLVSHPSTRQPSPLPSREGSGVGLCL